AAEAAFNRARALDRHSPDADLNLARLASRRGDLPAAESACQRALRRRPQDVRARYQLALIYWQRGQKREAQQQLDAAAKVAPESAAIRDLMGRIQRGDKFDATTAGGGS